MSNFKLKANSTFINVADKKKVTIKKVTLTGVILENNVSMPLVKCLNLIKDKVWVNA